jgi:PhoPQ-activated pathogenicity-related protein
MEQLASIPKYIVVSSNDEFMSMDWTSMYWDKLQGEKHLIIIPNSEHFMMGAIY